MKNSDRFIIEAKDDKAGSAGDMLYRILSSIESRLDAYSFTIKFDTLDGGNSNRRKRFTIHRDDEKFLTKEERNFLIIYFEGIKDALNINFTSKFE